MNKTDSPNMPPVRKGSILEDPYELFNGNMRLTAIQGDLTAIKHIDAIVNAANNNLIRGSGVCGSIFRAAGPELDNACAKIGFCPTGEAVWTPGFLTNAKYIIHTVGPIYDRDWDPGVSLANCYSSSLRIVREIGAESVAFPCISTGVYGYPKEEAAEVAVATVAALLKNSYLTTKVVFCCFDAQDLKIYNALLRDFAQHFDFILAPR